MRVLYDLKKQKSKMVGKVLVKIFHNKTFRKVFSLLVVLGLGYLVFSVGADCFAQNAAASVDSTETKLADFNQIASIVMKGLYGLLWPLLFVCGIALDNGLIYGTWLHLDAPLYLIWNIMKNFANFALGFFVIFAIVMNLFSIGKGGSKLKPKDVVTKTLIAGVLIQMSRFLPAAIIDVSTVLTYSIGGLPMTILEQNKEYQNTPILGVNSMLNADGKDLDFYYTYGKHKVYPCLVKKITDGALTGNYIIGPEKIFLKSGYFDTGYCEIGGWVYRYNHVEYIEGSGSTLYPKLENIQNTTGKNLEYKKILESILSTGRDFTGLLEACIILPLPDTKISAGCTGQGFGPLSLTGDDDFFKSDGDSILYTVNNLLEKSKGFVGPFITIYSSLLDVQSLVMINAHDDGVFPVFLEIIFKLFYLAVLVMPLVALAIVLIVRIGILWVVIAAAPALILIWVFEDKLGGLKDLLGKEGHFLLPNVIKLIFAPVFVVFAIGISMIFLTALSSTMKSGAKTQDVLNDLGIEKVENENGGSESSYSFAGGLVELDLNMEDFDKGKDTIAYMIMMTFAIGVIWFFLMAAVKLCGKTGEKWGKNIQEWGTDFAKTMPIIPIGGGVGIGTLTEALDKAPGEHINKMKNDSYKNLPDWLKSETKKKEKEEGNVVINNIIQRIQSGEITSYSSLKSEEQAVLTSTYGSAAAAEASITNMIKNRATYNDSSSNIKDRITAQELIEMREKTKSSAEALMMSSADLMVAVQNDKGWIKWAEGMIGGSVHTNDGVYMVDVVPGTENNPVYEILSRNDYETRHFGAAVENVSQDTFNEWKTKDEKKYEDMQKYLETMKKHFDVYSDFNGRRTDLNQDEQDRLASLEKTFTQSFIDKLSELDPGKFNIQGNQGQTGNTQ